MIKEASDQAAPPNEIHVQNQDTRAAKRQRLSASEGIRSEMNAPEVGSRQNGSDDISMRADLSDDDDDCLAYDTVGAVCVDARGEGML